VKELLADEARLAQQMAADSAEAIPSASGATAPGLPLLAVVAPVKPPAPRGPVVPDFRGKSMRSVVEEASAEGIEVMIEGSGVARAQVPQPGQPLRRGERIRIVFTR
jgi:hypothetical protein